MAKNLYNLTAVTTVNDSDLLHVNQGGVSSDKKVTKQNLLKEVNSSISSINNSLTQCLNFFTPVGSSGELLNDLNGAYTGMTGNGKLSIVRYYAESASSAHAPVGGDGICITYRATASYGVQFVLCNVGVYVRYINTTFGQWKNINYYT